MNTLRPSLRNNTLRYSPRQNFLYLTILIVVAFWALMKGIMPSPTTMDVETTSNGVVRSSSSSTLEETLVHAPIGSMGPEGKR